MTSLHAFLDRDLAATLRPTDLDAFLAQVAPLVDGDILHLEVTCDMRPAGRSDDAVRVELHLTTPNSTVAASAYLPPAGSQSPPAHEALVMCTPLVPVGAVLAPVKARRRLPATAFRVTHATIPHMG